VAAASGLKKRLVYARALELAEQNRAGMPAHDLPGENGA
jgi:hypothetical protein